MANEYINFQFKLTNVPNNIKTFNTKQSVKKRIADIVYVATPPDDAIKLEYVGSTELTSSINIFIGDRSDEIFANSCNNTVQEIIGDKKSNNIPVANKNFIITKQFINTSNTVIPLFYKTLLPSTVVPESVRILNSNSEEVSTSEYKLVLNRLYDEDTGSETGLSNGYYVFNSLENKYNHVTGEYDAYYIQYTTRSGSVETIVTTLLNNELAYQEATWEDYWYLTPGLLKPWAYAYAYNTTDFDTLYTVSLPTFGGNKYAVRYIEASRICVKHPVDYGDVGPWFPRIVNAGFSLSSNSIASRYEITEFNNQAFNPVSPYKLAARAQCIKVSDRLLKLPHENIVSANSLNYHYLDLTLEQDGEVKYAITNDPTKIGSAVINYKGDYVRDSDGDLLTWNNTYLIGIDNFSGIVYLDLNILDVYDIYATYTYKETYYTLSNLPMNPIFDPSLTSGIKVIYMVPKNIKNENIDTQEASIQWLNVASSGIILESSQNSSSGNINIDIDTKLTSSNGYSISGVVGLHYSLYKTCEADGVLLASAGSTINVNSTTGFPSSGWLRTIDSSNSTRYFKYTEKTSNTFVLATAADDFPSGTIVITSGQTIELVNFIDEYALQTRRVFDTELTYWQEDGIGPSMMAQYFILAELSINPPHGVKSLARIDVREDGGGILEDKYIEAKEKQPEVQWMSDYGTFEGQPYPGKAVAVVKLPITLKDDFTLDQIKAKVTECLPMGVYPLIRFYGYKPRISSVIPGSNSVTITWEKEGPEFIYQIWYAKTPLPDKKPNFILANTSPIFDGIASNNTYTITGLTEDIPYIIKITMEDRYYMWWYSYSSPTSISGGLGLTENAPIPPFGNVTNFQFSTL